MGTHNVAKRTNERMNKRKHTFLDPSFYYYIDYIDYIDNHHLIILFKVGKRVKVKGNKYKVLQDA